MILNTNEGTNSGSITIEDGTAGNILIEPQGKVRVTGTAAAYPQYALNQPVIIEDATRPGIQLVGSANNIGIIEFGDNAHANAGSINFDHSTNRLRFGFEDDAEKVYIDSSGDMVISGNLAVGDKLIELGNGVTGTPSGDAGIIIERGSSTNAAIIWDESRDEFVLGTTSATGASTGDLTVTPGNISVERIGAGTEQAEAEVHAKRDTASGVQYSTTATVIAEDDSRPSIQLAGAANNIGMIQFGDNAAVASGQIYYDHSTDKLRIDAGGNGDRLTVDADGDVAIAGDATVAGGIIVTGTAATAALTVNGTMSATGEVTANAGIDVKNGASGPGYVNFYEDSDNGSNSVTVIGPASTADVTLTLPSATDTLVGKATTDTLTNKTLTSAILTTPRIADDGFIADANGNEQIEFVTTTSAVNSWSISNAATGNAVILEAIGDDNDVGATFQTKGDGSFLFEIDEGGEGGVLFQLGHADAGVRLLAYEAGPATIELFADQGDDDADKWRIVAADGGVFAFQSRISSSYVDMFEITPNATAASTATAITGSLRSTGKFTSAGQVLAYAAKTANYETVVTDHVIVASRTITITLMENAPAGTVFTIKRVDDGTSNGTITTSRDGSDTIDGATSYALENNYDSVTVISDGANYQILSSVHND
jgi:hypothetical protein